MRLLLDTHIFLWFVSGSSKLPAGMREGISNPENEVYLSVVSIWESIIKYQLGKLPLPESPDIYLPKQRRRHRIYSLDVDEETVLQLAQLPPIHRDPFDRLLICQALRHNFYILTVDLAIKAYSVKLFEAETEN